MPAAREHVTQWLPAPQKLPLARQWIWVCRDTNSYQKLKEHWFKVSTLQLFRYFHSCSQIPAAESQFHINPRLHLTGPGTNKESLESVQWGHTFTACCLQMEYWHYRKSMSCALCLPPQTCTKDGGNPSQPETTTISSITAVMQLPGFGLTGKCSRKDPIHPQWFLQGTQNFTAHWSLPEDWFNSYRSTQVTWLNRGRRRFAP